MRSIPVYDSLTYEQFFANISGPNEPFILKNVVDRWPAYRDWRLADGQPNFDHLRSEYGHHNVTVADVGRRQFNEFERSERPLASVIDAWQSGQGDQLYVKDWHQVLQVEAEGGRQNEVYETPHIFQDDWLAPHALHTSGNDFRFTYAGPAGTFTPLHMDVYGSYSWSANVVGRKRWWLVPPDVQIDVDNVPFSVDELPSDRILVVDQSPGEIIFVPSCWYHQVRNLAFAISINQNFASSVTMPTMFAKLIENQSRVEASLSDVKEMIQQRLGADWQDEWSSEVQKVLAMDAGWDIQTFRDMLLCNMAHPPSPLRPPDGYILDRIPRLLKATTASS